MKKNVPETKNLTDELRNSVTAVAQKIELRTIRTVELFARLNSQPPDSVNLMDLAVEYAATPARLEDGFVVEGAFKLKAHMKEPDATTPPPQPFLEIRYRVGIRYGHPQPLPSDEILSAFAEMNGLVHLWPYFRAFVQESCGRMSVPPIIVPVFRAIGYGPEVVRQD
jgi:hypothetical protein